VYLDGVRDPGNVGTVIRTADAAGADAVILSPDCADIYNPKTVRSAMGSLFHIRTVVENEHLEYIKSAVGAGAKALAGALDADRFLYDFDMKDKIIVCVGNEAHGITDELKNLTGAYGVKIPMPGKAESLNASVAAGILIYEVVRQRRCGL
jgi:TrmH family RNA methyltransferase